MYAEARRALEPLLQDRLTQRVALLMARIEAGENGERGRVREWLARAMNAARDPAWIADSVISDHWEPISPDGRLDAFQWRVPVETRDTTRSEILARRLEELVALAPSSPVTSSATKTDADEPTGKAHQAAFEEAIEAELVTVPAARANGAATSIARSEVEPEAAATKAADATAASKAVAVKRRSADERSTRKRKEDANVFAPPPPPDDPGPEGSEGDAKPASPRTLRTVN
jgi:HemY protein